MCHVKARYDNIIKNIKNAKKMYTTLVPFPAHQDNIDVGYITDQITFYGST